MPVDDVTNLKKRVPGGKYALALSIAERAKQLQNGAMPLVEVRTPNPISVAIDEVLADKVTFDIKSEAQIIAEEEAAAKAAAAAAAAAEKAAEEEAARMLTDTEEESEEESDASSEE